MLIQRLAPPRSRHHNCVITQEAVPLLDGWHADPLAFVDVLLQASECLSLHVPEQAETLDAAYGRHHM